MSNAYATYLSRTQGGSSGTSGSGSVYDVYKQRVQQFEQQQAQSKVKVTQPTPTPVSTPNVTVTPTPQLSTKPVSKTQKFIQEGIARIKATPAKEFFLPTSTAFKMFVETATDKLKPGRDAFNKILNQVSTHGLVTPVGSEVPETPQGYVTSSGEVTSDYAKAKASYPEKPKTVTEKIGQDIGIAMSQLLQGYTGGIAKSNYEPKRLDEKIVSGVANVLGTVTSIRRISSFFTKIAVGNTTVANAIKEYPKVAKIALPLLQNVVGFDVYGQLDPDQKNRLQSLAKDTLLGTLFTPLGFIKQAKFSIPLSFGTGFGLVKLSGGSDEDAFIMGGILAGLDITGRTSRYLFEQQIVGGSKSYVVDPQDAIDAVLHSSLKNTAEGRLILKTALDARSSGQNVEIFSEKAIKTNEAKSLLNLKAPQVNITGVRSVDKPVGISGNEIVPTGGEITQKADTSNIEGMDKIASYKSAEDFAVAEYSAKATDQIGKLDPNTITPRDQVDPVRVEQYLSDIKAGKPIEPVEVTKSEDGTLTTTEGSHRVTAFQEAGQQVPVIYRGSDSIPGLSTIKDVYAQSTAQKEVTNVAPTETKPLETTTEPKKPAKVQEIAPKQLKNISKLTNSPKITYRVDTGFTQARGTTALDVVNFEEQMNGNDLKISPRVRAELKNIPSSQIIWVTRTSKQALRYGKEVQKVDTTGGKVLVDIGEDGILVLRPPQKPVKPIPAEKPQSPTPPKPITTKPQKATPPPKAEAIHKRIVSKRSTIPLLGGVVVKDGQMMSTDLNVSVSTPTDKAPGFYEFVGNDLVARPAMDVRDFPKMEKVTNSVGQILSENLNQMMKDLLPSTSGDETRPILTGIHLVFNKTGIQATSTDGYRIFRKTYGYKPANIKPGVEAIVTSEVAKAVPVLSEGISDIKISHDIISFSSGDTEVQARLLEGNYPLVESILPHNIKTIWNVDGVELAQAMKDLKPYADESANIVTFNQKGDKLIMKAGTDETNKTVEITSYEKKLPEGGVLPRDFGMIMPIRQEAESQLALNYKYVMDMVKQILPTPGGYNAIDIGFTNTKTAVAFTEPDSIKPGEKVAPAKVEKEGMLPKSTPPVEPAEPKPIVSKGEELGFNPKNLEEPLSPKSDAEVKKIVKRSEIAKMLSEKLNVPIRQGKFRHPGALGIFKPRQKVVRIKSGGLATIFHEVGHFLDSNLALSKDINIKERKALMVEYGYTYEGQAEKQRKEAFAEYLRFTLTGQDEKVTTLAPEFDKQFKKRMQEYPEIKAVLDTAKEDYSRWQQLPATSKVLSQLSIGKQTGKTLKEKASYFVHDLYTQTLDDLHPLDAFTNLYKKNVGKLEAEQDPYILARNLRGWVGKADLFLNKGTFGKNFWKKDANGNTVMNFNGKSYTEIMKPVGKAGVLDDFRVYIIAQRIVNDLAPRGIKTGISVADARSALAELEQKYPEFEQVAQERRDYKDRLLEFAQQNGLIGEEALAKIKELNKFHVPFYRVMEESTVRFLGKSKFAGNTPNPIKKIKGSEREIIDPIESDIKDTYAIINASERNNIGVAMANIANANYELGRLFEEVVRPMRPVTVNVEEVLTQALKGSGLTPADIPEGLSDLVVTLFRPMQDHGQNMLNVNFGDQQKVFQVDPDLFRAIQGMNVEDIATFFKIIALPAKVLRAGATLTPDFSVRNPLRDQFTAFVYSKYGFIPGVDLVRGMFELFKQGDVYDLWKASGGEHSMFVSLDRDALQKNYKELMRNKGTLALDYAKNPLKILQIISEFGEAGTRLGEMKRGLQAGASPIQSGFASREVTLDFARIGAKTKAFNMITAFFNANLQGTDKMVREFKTHPFRTLLKVLLGITLPSILLYLANRKDPRWKEIPTWQKDLFWIILTPKHIIRIPKPFELGILFGSVPERALEFMDTNDPHILNELEKSIASGFTPGFLPTALIPIIENITNYSFFLDRPIISQGTENLPPGQQSNTYTSEFAKIVGEALNYSPAKVDNLITGYTGGLGKYAVSALDGILKGTGVVNVPTAPSKNLEDMPVAKAFLIREPIGSGSESVNRVYDLYAVAEPERAFANRLVKDGKTEEAKAYVARHPEILTAKILGSATTTFSDMNKAIKGIRNSRELSADEKRTKIREIQVLQTKLAQKTLQYLKDNPVQ